MNFHHTKCQTKQTQACTYNTVKYTAKQKEIIKIVRWKEMNVYTFWHDSSC